MTRNDMNVLAGLVEQRLEHRFEKIDQRLEALDQKIDQRFGQLAHAIGELTKLVVQHDAAQDARIELVRSLQP